MIYAFLCLIIFCQWWGHRTQRKEDEKLKKLNKEQSKQIRELQGLLGHCRDKNKRSERWARLSELAEHNKWLINHYETRIGKLTHMVHMYEKDLRERDKDI